MLAFKGYQTAPAANTPFTLIFAAKDNYIPRLDKFRYTAGATEHTLTVMRSVGWTLTSAESASGISTLTLESLSPGLDSNGDDEPLAASDWVGWTDENGIYYADSVASVSGSTITLDNALPSRVLSGAKVWGFYEVGRAVHTQLKLRASTTEELDVAIQGGFSIQDGVKTQRSGENEPLLLHVDNITAAGDLYYASVSYVPKSSKVVG